MRYSKRYTYIPKYEYAGTNQHGDRYKQTGTDKVSSCAMFADMGNVDDMRKILILSDQLDTPVTYDFDKTPQTASIEIVSKRSLS